MTAFVSALAPILILILLGQVLRRIHFLPDQAWAGLEKLTYFILFPALLVSTLGRQSLGDSPWPLMLMIIAGTLFLAAFLLITWFKFYKSVSQETFTSIFQGGIRFNTYILLAIALAFYGEQGLALSAIAAGFMIVLVNLMCISAFVIWGSRATPGLKPFIKEVFANPLIISCAVGWLLSLSGIGLPGISFDILEIVGRAALPFGLLAVGAALRTDELHGQFKSILVSSFVQFFWKPVFAVFFIMISGLTGIAAGVLIIAFMSPTAPSAYILARQLGGDTETMASIITVQTILAFLVMPIIAYFTLTP